LFFLTLPSKKKPDIEKLLLVTGELWDLAYVVALSILGLRPPYNPFVKNRLGGLRALAGTHTSLAGNAIFRLALFEKLLKNNPKSHRADVGLDRHEFDSALIWYHFRKNPMGGSYRNLAGFFFDGFWVVFFLTDDYTIDLPGLSQKKFLKI
jgi:hypothetical protein